VRNRANSRLVTLGETTASPAATLRIAETKSSGGVSLSRNPLAPARIAPTTCSSRSKVVITSTREPASDEVISAVAATPSRPGIRTSMRTTSGE